MNFLYAAFNWYGFAIGGGMALCIILSYLLTKRRGYDSDIVFNIALVCIPMAIVGARLGYIFFDIVGADGTWQGWFSDLTWAGIVRDANGKLGFGLSGLMIYGGLVFAFLGAVIVRYFNKKKKPAQQMTLLQMADFFFVMIILGQAIGRWGNFANQEAYGNPVTNPDLQFFPLAVFIDRENAWFQATFFYEFLVDIIGFALLFWLCHGKRKSYDGFVFSGYCLWYGTGRLIIEALRSDSLMIGSIKVSQLISIVLMAFGAFNIAYHLYMARKTGKKAFIFVDESKLDTSYYGYEKTIMYIKKMQDKIPPDDKNDDNPDGNKPTLTEIKQDEFSE